MSERSLETLIGDIYDPPELDPNEDVMNGDYSRAFYDSSKIELLDAIGTPDFKDEWLVLKGDIQNETLKLQRIFSEQTLDKISEIYDFEFPIKLDLDVQGQIDDFYKFLQFLEYENTEFITNVWQFLGPKNLIKLDIEKFCKDNDNKIIKETEEQLEIHPQPGMIALFLRTYYKEKYIEWFIKNSIKAKFEITVELNQRKEK
jgi:hypothetical protein